MAMMRRVAMLLVAFVLLFRFTTVHGLYEGVLECEELTPLECAFSVSSAGARCVLEKSTLPNGAINPSCQTSTIMAERPVEWIETEECIQGCGLDRETYGLSTDSLGDSGFVGKLCSDECQSNCPNIVDIFFKLSAGEGKYLPRLCNEQKFKARRLIADSVKVRENGLQASTKEKSAEKPLESVLAAAETPLPQPSSGYDPVPKDKKPVSVPTSPPAPAAPVAAPTPAPSPSLPVYEVSSTRYSSRFGDDFEEY